MQRIIQTFRGEFATIDQGSRALRNFGLIVGGIILAIAVFALWKGKPVHLLLPSIGGILVILGLIAPKTLRIPHVLWMGLAIVLGFFVGNLLLGALFYVFVTPIALLRRAFQGKRQQRIETHWITREKSWTKESMEQLF